MDIPRNPESGAVNDVHKISAEFAICRKPVIVAQV